MEAQLPQRVSRDCNDIKNVQIRKCADMQMECGNVNEKFVRENSTSQMHYPIFTIAFPHYRIIKLKSRERPFP